MVQLAPSQKRSDGPDHEVLLVTTRPVVLLAITGEVCLRVDVTKKYLKLFTAL